MQPGVISIDVQGARDLATRMGTVADELEHSSRFTSDVVGSPAVDGALREFHNKWSDKRGELIGSLRDADTFLKDTASEFESRDSELSASLEGS